MNRYFMSLLIGIIISIVSCSDKDDDNNNQYFGSISIEELESTPSFVYVHNNEAYPLYSYETYIWFRKGKMNIFKHGATQSRSFTRQFSYTLSDQKLTLTSSSYGITTKYEGYLSKYIHGDKRQLVLSLGLTGKEPEGNLPDDYLHWYDYSSISISE